MASDRNKLRGVVLAEDKRTERFFRELLRVLGFSTRRFRFDTAPAGEGAAEAWVAQRYPNEVKALRSKNYQRALRLVAARDGDAVGCTARMQELDEALINASLEIRQPQEGIATPVPTRNIETWLLALTSATGIDETTDYKQQFERKHRTDQKAVLKKAAAGWNDIDDRSSPSLLDGVAEMQRIDP